MFRVRLGLGRGDILDLGWDFVELVVEMEVGVVVRLV